MEAEIFEKLRELIHSESGIYLGDEKETLLENRIHKRLRALKLGSEQEYLEFVELDVDGSELAQLLDVVSTNVTYFYREEAHFKILGSILQELESAQKMPIKIWCAASSSGEEPYTMSMVAESEMHSPEIKILATDISRPMLAKAKMRLYEAKQLEKLPPAYVSNYFEKVVVDGDTKYKVIDSIAQKVSYKRLNLVEQPFQLKEGLDIIFCRNVMIYFQTELRGKLISEFTRLLKPGGYLFLSHSENLLGVKHSLESYKTAVYRKPGGRK